MWAEALKIPAIIGRGDNWMAFHGTRSSLLDGTFVQYRARLEIHGSLCKWKGGNLDYEVF